MHEADLLYSRKQMPTYQQLRSGEILRRLGGVIKTHTRCFGISADCADPFDQGACKSAILGQNGALEVAVLVARCRDVQLTFAHSLEAITKLVATVSGLTVTWPL